MCRLLSLLLLVGCAEPVIVSPEVSQPLPTTEAVTIATWNLKWFFDDDKSDNRSDLARRMSAPSRQDYLWKLDAVADGIAKLRPTVIVLQEVENERVVKELAQRLKERHQLSYQVGFVQGFDNTTEQDVAILAQGGLQAVRRLRLPIPMQRDRDNFKDLSKHLVAEITLRKGQQQLRLIVMTVHLISGGGEAERVKQARVIHYWLHDRIVAGDNIVILGDFNCEVKPEASTARDSCVGIACGLHTPETNDDLNDLLAHLPPGRQETHASRKPLDRILVSRPLTKDGKGSLVFDQLQTFRELAIRGKRDTGDNPWDTPREERDVSDHYPLMATFQWRR